MLEKRKRERFKISLPCRISYLDETRRDLLGTTINISRFGMLVGFFTKTPHSHVPLHHGMSVAVEMLPAAQTMFRYLVCRGTVLRIRTLRDGRVQLAIALEEMKFSRHCREKLAPQLADTVMSDGFQALNGTSAPQNPARVQHISGSRMKSTST